MNDYYLFSSVFQLFSKSVAIKERERNREEEKKKKYIGKEEKGIQRRREKIERKKRERRRRGRKTWMMMKKRKLYPSWTKSEPATISLAHVTKKLEREEGRS